VSAAQPIVSKTLATIPRAQPEYLALHIHGDPDDHVDGPLTALRALVEHCDDPAPRRSTDVSSPTLSTACGVPKLGSRLRPGVFLIGSGCASVLVDKSAEDSVASDRGVKGDLGGEVVGWWVLIQALVRAVVIEAYRSRTTRACRSW